MLIKVSLNYVPKKAIRFDYTFTIEVAVLTFEPFIYSFVNLGFILNGSNIKIKRKRGIGQMG